MDHALVEFARAITGEVLEPMEAPDGAVMALYTDGEPMLISPDFTPSAGTEPESSQLDVIDGEAALTLLVAQRIEKCFYCRRTQAR